MRPPGAVLAPGESLIATGIFLLTSCFPFFHHSKSYIKIKISIVLVLDDCMSLEFYIHSV